MTPPTPQYLISLSKYSYGAVMVACVAVILEAKHIVGSMIISFNFVINAEPSFRRKFGPSNIQVRHKIQLTYIDKERFAKYVKAYLNVTPTDHFIYAIKFETTKPKIYLTINRSCKM